MPRDRRLTIAVRGLGVQMAAVDANQLVTQWAHDGFGRTTREVRPDGTSTTFALTRTKDGGPAQDRWNVKLRTVTPGVQDDTVEHDSLGRVVKRWTQGVHVNALPVQRVVETITFDHLGQRVARRS